MSQQIQVKIEHTAEQIVYSDVVLVNGSPMGFVLNFGQWAPEQPGVMRVYSRVGLSPNHLKLLAQLLNQNIAGYEQQFGKIVVGEQPQAPHQHIGFQPAAKPPDAAGSDTPTGS